MADRAEPKTLGELKVQTGPLKSINEEKDVPNFTNSFNGDDKCYDAALLKCVEELGKMIEQMKVLRSENINGNGNVKAMIDHVNGESQVSNQRKETSFDFNITYPVNKVYIFIFILSGYS